MTTRKRPLSARLEPFDSFWQGPKDVEKGYRSWNSYYRANVLPRIPAERSAKILCISAGPGYLVNVLRNVGYTEVRGIDSDPEKVRHAEQRGLPVRTAEAFPYLEEHPGEHDVIVAEQELNHLTKDETLEFLELTHGSLRPGGTVVVYSLNGANPITGPDSMAINIDHFHTLTENSLREALELAGFEAIRPFPLKLYVFWTNPLNYVGLVATGLLHLGFRCLFILYGKSNKIWTKKLGASGRKPS
jgi:SAM-dependent methyltransferase